MLMRWCCKGRKRGKREEGEEIKRKGRRREEGWRRRVIGKQGKRKRKRNRKGDRDQKGGDTGKGI